MFENFFDILLVPIGFVIRICYKLIPNYAIALLLFAIIMKVVLFPLGIKQQKNMVKQAALRPKEMAIRKRYAGRDDAVTKQKLNEDIMKLYQSENFNPMGGCMPLLFQLPILYALYAVINNPLKYICGVSSAAIKAISTKITELYVSSANLFEGLSSDILTKLATAAEKEQAPVLTGIENVNIIRHLGIENFAEHLPEGFSETSLPSFSMFGGKIDLAAIPSFNSLLVIIPILTFVIVFFSMKLTRKMSYQPTENADAGMSMKIMDFTMPLLSVWIAFTVPAVIGVYWIYQNVLSTVQQFILKAMYPIPVFTEEDYKRVEKEMNGNLSNKAKKKKVRSLHRIDEEDDENEESSDDAEKKPEAPKKKTLSDPVSELVSAAPLKEDDRKHTSKDNDKSDDTSDDAADESQNND